MEGLHGELDVVGMIPIIGEVADPVNVASGEVMAEAVDFSLNGPISLVWERTWYSSSTYAGPLGHEGSYRIWHMDGLRTMRWAISLPSPMPGATPCVMATRVSSWCSGPPVWAPTGISPTVYTHANGLVTRQKVSGRTATDR